MIDKGLFIIISGPSGSGKGTIVDKIMQENPQYVLSISNTTRDIRHNEKYDVDYVYITHKEFEKRIEKDFYLEYAKYNNDYYGSPKAPIETAISQGKDVILEIEVQGTKRIKDKTKNIVSIFVVPPSFKELEKRLKDRATETDEEIKRRLDRAKEEIKHISQYDYVVINDNVDKAVLAINSIIIAENHKYINSKNKIKEVLKDV